MVWQYGMGKSGRIGNWGDLVGHHGQSFISEKTKEILDDDVQSILQECLAGFGILNTNRQLLDYFAQELLSQKVN